MKNVILITDAACGCGAAIAREVAKAGHIVYAGIRDARQKNMDKVLEAQQFEEANDLDFRWIDLDLNRDESAAMAVQKIVAESGRIDVIVHSPSDIALGPAEAFIPIQYAQLYDMHVLGAQRVNRAALPSMRRRGSGLLTWVAAPRTFQNYGPYAAAKIAMETIANAYAMELAPFGIGSVIVRPSVLEPRRAEPAVYPADLAVAAIYRDWTTRWFREQELSPSYLEDLPTEADITLAKAIASLIDMPPATRPGQFDTGTRPKQSV